jgi:NTP pyrophosphatase (non-canonical NTP hydrolase)
MSPDGWGSSGRKTVSARCGRSGIGAKIGHVKRFDLIGTKDWPRRGKRAGRCAPVGEHMEATEYQRLAARTLIDKPGFEISDRDLMAVWDAIGLAGEAGEVVEHIKKGVFHQHGIDLQKIERELGDTLWYVAALCTTLGLDMAEIMRANIEKLEVRYPNGYTSVDSQRRVDVNGT